MADGGTSQAPLSHEQTPLRTTLVYLYLCILLVLFLYTATDVEGAETCFLQVSLLISSGRVPADFSVIGHKLPELENRA